MRSGARERVRIGIMASGRGSNFEALVRAARQGQIDAEIAVVITDREGAPVLERAEKLGVPAVFVNPRGHTSKGRYEQAVVGTLEEHGVHLVCLAGYMRIVGKDFVGAYEGRMMNIHPSLLPAFPGLDAQAQALEYGVKLSGCTVHFVDEGVDTGPIILQETVPVLDMDTVADLSQRILTVEHRLYAEAVRLFAQGRLRISGRRVIIDKD